MTERHPHRRKILAAITAGTLAIFGGCYLISDDDGDEDEDVADDRENETEPSEPADPNETNRTTDPDLNTTDPDDC